MERKKRAINGVSISPLIKKGPWTSEEDEILRKYVKKHGPRDWSSLRSMGLLPRTGKSCRLRWVNKLRPNLKSGCRFSEEEERMVIELQAKYGNKWAQIATCLHGRTDNDVKNFWSARRKRLAKNLLLRPAPSSPENNGINLPLYVSPNAAKEESSASIDVQLHLTPGKFGDLEMFPNLETEFLSPDIRNISSSESSTLPCPFSYPLSFPECEELVPDPNPSRFVDLFFGEEGFNLENDLTWKLPSLGLEANTTMGMKIEKSATPDNFLDEFSTDIFDQLESLPSMSDW